MADRYPLIVDSSTNTVKEIPSGDNLNLSGSSIVNANTVSATNVVTSGVSTITTIVVNDVDLTPITGIATIYVTTSGNDTTGDGTLASPYATPHKAINTLRYKRIKVTDGYQRVTINVGVGTYNFGLKQTANGTNYLAGTYPVSGGSGTGAFVAITTTTNGAVNGVKLTDPGTGYLAGENLGINTTTGSGCALNILNVGDEGEILGPLRVDHIDGDQILITGGTLTGTKPGRRGNHFYNQVGVPDGADPTSTIGTASTTWGKLYDSTSSSAYPNPMADGQGNTSVSESFNRGKLEAYYGTKFYFYGSDGLVSYGSNPAKVDKLALIGLTSKGTVAGITTSGAFNTGIGTIAPGTSAVTNVPATGISTDQANASNQTGGITIVGRNTVGSFDFGNNISLHGFTVGINLQYGGLCSADLLTMTNLSGTGIQVGYGAVTTLSNCHILNTSSHAIFSYHGTITCYGGSLSNNGYYGALNHYNGFMFLGNTSVATEGLVGFGNSTIIANNNYPGVYVGDGSMVRCDGRYTQPSYVFSNGKVGGGAQIAAISGGLIDIAGANLIISQGDAASSAVMLSPAANTIGNGNSYITQ